MAVTFNADPGTILNFLSGLLMIGIGVFAAMVKPRRRANLAFAAFAASFGAIFTTANLISAGGISLFLLGRDSPIGVYVWALGSLFVVLASVSLVLVAIWFPRAVKAADRRALVLASVAALAYAVPFIILRIVFWSAAQAAYLAQGLSEANSTAANLRRLLLDGVLVGTFVFVLVFLAQRASAPMRAQREREWRHDVLMSIALLLWPASAVGSGLVGGYSSGSGVLAPLALGVASLLLVAVLWLRNTWQSGPPASRSSRNVALLVLLVPLCAAALQIALNPAVPESGQTGVIGFARTLAVVVFAYAILRHQLLGLDVKVKWTISQGTVAAVVLGVFFMVTSLAQNFLSEQYGWIYGGIATGVLLFAIHPLQRIGERVANAALPGVKPIATMEIDERLSLYRDQVTMAYADEAVDVRERALLRAAQARLHLNPDQAARIEDEVVRSKGASS